MKLFRLLLLLGCCGGLPAFAAKLPPSLQVLPRTRPDRLYQLQINLPASFAKDPNKKYPVVFVTDGYWQFTSVTSTYWGLVYGKTVPEMLVVGLGYAGDNLDYDQMRGDDLSPMGVAGTGGHAEQFLDLIEHVAMPLLERDYRADPHHRYLLGSSAGGLFTLYAAFTRPALFQGYVADSPSVAAAIPYERTFAKAHRNIPGRVYISAAENEWPGYRALIESFYRQLDGDSIVKGGLSFHLVEHTRHAGSTPESYMQGLLYVTQPIAPEAGPQHDGIYSDPERRPLYCVYYSLKQPTADTAATLKAHDAWLTQLMTQKQVVLAGGTPTGAKQTFSGFLMFSADRSTVVALAKASPAVKAGALDFEVLPSADAR